MSVDLQSSAVQKPAACRCFFRLGATPDELRAASVCRSGAAGGSSGGGGLCLRSWRRSQGLGRPASERHAPIGRLAPRHLPEQTAEPPRSAEPLSLVTAGTGRPLRSRRGGLRNIRTSRSSRGPQAVPAYEPSQRL